jgi:site-specific recombinase XerC
MQALRLAFHGGRIQARAVAAVRSRALTMATIKLTEKSLATLAPGTYWDETVRGLCVEVYPRARTFYVMTRSAGKRVRVRIGMAGGTAPGGQTWTVANARRKAQEIIGKAAAGELAPQPKRATGPTLRQGLELHVTAMQRRRRAERSISQIQDEVKRYLAAWLDRPMAELTSAALDAACNALMAAKTPAPGSDNPPGAATAKRLLAHVSAIWTSTRKLHALPGMNPAEGVTPHALLPRQERVDDADLPAWLAKVQKLRPVRRDLHLFCLFSGLRSESARSLRWDDVDFDRALLHVRKAKGDKPYTIPLAPTHLEILRRRQIENAPEFGPWGGDHGWVFPGIALRTKKVQPVASGRQWQPRQGKITDPLPGLHALRRTFNSVAQEIGIPLEDREALMNHNGQGVNLRVYTVPQRWDHLADCQRRIEAALLERLGQVDESGRTEVQSKKSRAHLRVHDGGR